LRAAGGLSSFQLGRTIKKQTLSFPNLNDRKRVPAQKVIASFLTCGAHLVGKLKGSGKGRWLRGGEFLRKYGKPGQKVKHQSVASEEGGGMRKKKEIQRNAASVLELV